MCEYVCGQVTHEVSCLGEGSPPASRLYESGSNDRQIAGIQSVQACDITDGACLAVERQQVVVDPEPKAHVWIEQQVQDGTTRYTSVFVDAAFAVRNLNNSTQRVDDHALNAVRCTARNVDEHVVIASEMDASLVTQ